MQFTPRPGAVTDVSAEELRAFMATHREEDYLLVDVRQLEEYRAGHIPGSKLMPLGELGERFAELEAERDRHLVFYCRSGGRSARAAAYAVSTGLPRIYNLVGGFVGWSGTVLDDLPRLSILDPGGPVETVIERAIDLEKGAHRLYDALRTQLADPALSQFAEHLARAEIGHGRILYDALVACGAEPAQSFEELFDSLPGKLLESGESYDVVVARAQQMAQHGSSALLELALEVELRAFDLYKNLADRAGSPAARQTLLDLAQQEKRHAASVLNQLGQIASRAG